MRLSYVLKIWTDLLRSHQMLHRKWVVIKVVFGFVKKHAVRHSWSRWDLPLSTRERYLRAPRVIWIRKCMAMLGLRVNQGFRITGSRKEWSASSKTKYREAKGTTCIRLWLLDRYELRVLRSWYVLLETAINYWPVGVLGHVYARVSP